MEVVAKADDIEGILRGIVIPSPPQVIADLQMEMAMPDPDLNSMSDLIVRDAGLAGAVLKTVNSPFYGVNREVTSINQAVMMLGIKTILDIINTLCLKNAMLEGKKMSDNMYATMTRFWDSAADVARVSEIVAKKVGISPVDNTYLLGLFHNVGIALLITKDDSFLDTMEKTYAQSAERIVDIENEILNTNHAVISYYAARSWKIDSRLCKIIARHHDLDLFMGKNVDDSFENIMLGILKIAEHLVGLFRILGNQEVDHEWEKIGDNVLVCVGLTSYEFDDLKSQVAELGYGQQFYFR